MRCALAHSAHDRYGRRNFDGARIINHQNTDSFCNAARQRQHAKKSQETKWHNAICQALSLCLNVGFGFLRFIHHLYNVCNAGLSTSFADFNHNIAILCNGASKHSRTSAFNSKLALAGHGSLVDSGLTSNNSAINWNHRPSANANFVSWTNA